MPSNTSGGVLKKTSSPEIKLKIIKTYQNGKELFESALCGDLLQELQVLSECLSLVYKVHVCFFGKDDAWALTCKSDRVILKVIGVYFSCLQESQKKEAAQLQRRHEQKKEKRKKSARLQLQVQEQSLNQSQIQAGTLTPTDDPHMHPQLVETPQTEKPQKTTVKTVPKTPKARPA